MFYKTDLDMFCKQNILPKVLVKVNLRLFVFMALTSNSHIWNNSYYLTELGNVRTALLMIYRLDIM